MNDSERRRAQVATWSPENLAAYDAAPDDVRAAMARVCELMADAAALGPWRLDLNDDEQRDALCELMGLCAGAAQRRTT
jgi:hypothetical protein